MSIAQKHEKGISPALQTTGSYPSTTAIVSGSVTVSAMVPTAPLTIYYRLAGMAPSSTGGLHIHTGTSCTRPQLPPTLFLVLGGG